MSREQGGDNSWPGMDLRMTPNVRHRRPGDESKGESILIDPYHDASEVAQHARDAGSEGSARMLRRERVRIERRGRVRDLSSAG